jgi:hypothetical protein
MDAHSGFPTRTQGWQAALFTTLWWQYNKHIQLMTVSTVRVTNLTSGSDSQ